MWNMIIADTKRVFRGKGIYITLAILIAFIAMNMIMASQIGNLGTTGDLIETLHGSDDPNTAVLERAQPVTGATLPFLAMANVDSVAFILLALCIFIAGTDFSAGTVKNVLASGVSRTKYYFSKLIGAGIFTVILYLLYMLLSTVVGFLVLGYEGTLDYTWFLNLLRPALGQLWMLLASAAFMVSVAFITKKTAGVIAIYFAFMFVPRMIMMAIASVNPRFVDLFRFDYTENMVAFSQYATLSDGDITRALGLGLGLLVISVCLGGILFRKAEIK